MTNHEDVQNNNEILECRLFEADFLISKLRLTKKSQLEVHLKTFFPYIYSIIFRYSVSLGFDLNIDQINIYAYLWNRKFIMQICIVCSNVTQCYD